MMVFHCFSSFLDPLVCRFSGFLLCRLLPAGHLGLGLGLECSALLSRPPEAPAEWERAETSLHTDR